MNIDGSTVGIVKCCSKSQTADRDTKTTSPPVVTFINRYRHRFSHQTHPTHQIDECTPLETLQGNDHYASSRSDCHLYLPPVSVCYTPVSIEDNNSFFYDAQTPFSAMSGPQCIAPRLDQPRTAEERLFAFLRGVGTAVNRCDVFGVLVLSVPLDEVSHMIPHTFRAQRSCWVLAKSFTSIWMSYSGSSIAGQTCTTEYG